MFNWIGAKIKGLTKIICGIGIIASVVSGGILLSSSFTMIAGIVVIIFGPLLSWISSFLLYGFGELIDSVMHIADMMSTNAGFIHKTDLPSTWKCVRCGQENTYASAQCKGCGQYKT